MSWLHEALSVRHAVYATAVHSVGFCLACLRRISGALPEAIRSMSAANEARTRQVDALGKSPAIKASAVQGVDPAGPLCDASAVRYLKQQTVAVKGARMLRAESGGLELAANEARTRRVDQR